MLQFLFLSKVDSEVLISPAKGHASYDVKSRYMECRKNSPNDKGLLHPSGFCMNKGG